MNPIFQAVISRVVMELNRRCPVCDGRLEIVRSGKHLRRRCATCGADVASRASIDATTVRRVDRDAHTKRPLRRQAQRRRRARP